MPAIRQPDFRIGYHSTTILIRLHLLSPQHCHPERSEGSAAAFATLNVALADNPTTFSSGTISSTPSTVILNAVKDPRLHSRVFKALLPDCRQYIRDLFRILSTSRIDVNPERQTHEKQPNPRECCQQALWCREEVMNENAANPHGHKRINPDWVLFDTTTPDNHWNRRNKQNDPPNPRSRERESWHCASLSDV